MVKNIWRILAVSFGYIAAIIGAGFASGQEIVSYFVRYGKNGIAGIVISCVGFAVFSYAVLSACAEKKIYSYADFIDEVFSCRLTRMLARLAVFACSAAALCVMTACAGEIGAEIFDLPEIVGAASFITMCGMIFFMRAKSIMGINSALGGAIIVGIIFICFYILRFREHQTMSRMAEAGMSGAVYAGYNIIGTGAVLAGMSRLLDDKRDALISSFVSGIVLFIMISLMCGVLGIYYGKIDLGEIPMLTMAQRQGRGIGFFYALMLSAAVLSTGVSCGFAVTDILERRLSHKTAVITVTLSALAVSGAGFAVLVNSVYRACGYIGAIVAVMMVVKSLIYSKK